MTISVALKREYELIGTDPGGDPCIFPRDPSNPIFVDAFDFRTKIIDDSQPTRYLAFPYVVKVGSSLVGIFSESDSHASGSNQWMIRSDDNGLTWSKVLFVDAASPSVYDTSLLSGVLGSGDTVVLKVWTIKNNAGTLQVTTQSSVSYGGNTYFMWSRPVNAPTSKLWRTGYAVVGSDIQTALFESSDGGVTWAGKSVMFAGVGKKYNEADIVNLNGSAWLAIAREDSGSLYNEVYYSYSEDDGATWSTPVLYDPLLLNGRQPNLIKVTDGSILFSSADRKSGSTSYAPDGNIIPYVYDQTGVVAYKSPLISLDPNPLTSNSSGTTGLNVSSDSHGLQTGDVVYLYGSSSVDGIPASEINTVHTITKLNNNSFSIATTTVATTGATAGGGSSVAYYCLSRFGYRTRIAGMYSSDGGQPYCIETTANSVCTVFYHRRAVDQKPIIASSSYNTINL